MVKFGAGQVDPNSLDNRVTPGKYHIQVTNVDENGGPNNDKVIVDYEVLNGTDPRSIGRSGREYFATTEKAISRLMMLALALGLVTPDQVAENNRLGRDTDIDFRSAVGRTMLVECAKNGQYTNFTYSGMWNVNSDAPECRDIPRLNKATPVGAGGGRPGSGPVAESEVPF